jgi:hypothetical protein
MDFLNLLNEYFPGQKGKKFSDYKGLMLEEHHEKIQIELIKNLRELKAITFLKDNGLMPE